MAEGKDLAVKVTFKPDKKLFVLEYESGNSEEVSSIDVAMDLVLKHFMYHLLRTGSFHG